MERILLLGAGALARDILDTFGVHGFIAAYVDPGFVDSSDVNGVPIISDWREATNLASHYLLAISGVEHRERVIALSVEAGLPAATPLVSKSAHISGSAKLAPGCVVGHTSVVGSEARIGSNVLVMHGVVVGHNCVIEDNVAVCPGASLGGYSSVGTCSFIGTNAVIAPRVTIGEKSFLGAGAACLKDFPAYSLLIGNPARRSTVPR